MRRHSFQRGPLRLSYLDDGGDGHSYHAASYTRHEYVADLSGLLDHLGLKWPVLFGNSLGGVNAYRLAARRPDPCVPSSSRTSVSRLRMTSRSR